MHYAWPQDCHGYHFVMLILYLYQMELYYLKQFVAHYILSLYVGLDCHYETFRIVIHSVRKYLLTNT
jgi:hypothetical protein